MAIVRIYRRFNALEVVAGMPLYYFDVSSFWFSHKRRQLPNI